MTDYYSEQMWGPFDSFELGELALASGYTLPDAQLTYRTHGTLNDAKDNAILFPHMYSGIPCSMEIYVGEGHPLDPADWFVILPGQLGGGFSSSPSNTAPPYDRGQFPPMAIADDVHAQHRLVTEHFGITQLHAVLGWSMGGQQTYAWAATHPEMVPRAAVFAATLQTPVHNQIFVDVHLELLRSDPAFAGGFYERASDVREGLKRHAAAFSLMGLSARWWRDECWRDMGFASADDMRQGFIRGYFAPMDPNNLISQADKWRASDLAGLAGGDLAAAAAQITGRVWVVPFSEDLFFPPEDCEADSRLIPNATYRVIDTPTGHFAMFGLREKDIAAIDEVIAEVLAS